MANRNDVELAASMAAAWGVKIAVDPVCEGHSAPAKFLAEWIFDGPPISLVHGPRGGGKSYLRALAIHVDSINHRRLGTRILGGSLAQSQQIYQALESFYDVDRDTGDFRRLLKTEAEYASGSKVSILAASRTSVRGPHVARLCLDEVDEIDPDIRDSAFGMCMEMHGVPASVSMTSTWHRVGGPMAALIDRGRAGEFPVHTFCAFEVLERCPEERSGKSLERCPECPLMQWCHSDRDARADGLPKAKRSNGHYAIDSLIQKVRAVSLRVFQSDYLCLGPKADGVWFKDFDDARNVTEDAEYDPSLPIHVAVDSGVFTGGIVFQVRETGGDRRRQVPPTIRVNVFADHLSEGIGAENAGAEIVADLGRLCDGARRRVSTDSAGGSRNPVGPTVLSEYAKVGLVGENGIELWPKYPGCVLEGLALIESLIRSADGSTRLTIHPRCKHLIDGLKGYTRARRGGQWMDYPADPQHPHEDLVDALRGGLATQFPDGVGPQPERSRISGGRL